ncbi:MAG: polysaccharide deacetylase family protein [Acutalibacteraceae bacterium]
MKRIKGLVSALVALQLCLLSGCADKELSAPSGAVAQADGADIVLEWQAADGADFYRIYRRENGNADFKFICDEPSTKYTDSTAKADINYRYKVTAVRGNEETKGALTDETAIISNSGNADTALYAPAVTSVTKMDKYENVIIFSPNNNGCNYEIRRSKDLGGEYTLIGTTDESVYYDDTANGEAYYYTVTAVRGDKRSKASVAQKTGKNAQKVFRVPVLMYHEFVTQADLDSGVAFDEYAVWQDEFESDLIWLKKNGYTTVTTVQLKDCLEGNGTMPEKPVIITIDDGKYGVYKNAYPLLKKYGMTAALSLIGYEIDNATKKPETRESSDAPYCTWEEIAEMSKSGAVEMISHTQSLHIFSHGNRCGANCADGETLEAFLMTAQEDFLKFNQSLENATGTRTETMAYPYSKRSVTADRAWLKSGYKILLGGDGDGERKTYMNYYVPAAGINSKSAVTRRIPRMTGTPVKDYIDGAVQHDA